MTNWYQCDRCGNKFTFDWGSLHCKQELNARELPFVDLCDGCKNELKKLIRDFCKPITQQGNTR